MDEAPPPESFIAYPRATAGRLDTAARLKSLSDGYFGLNYVLLLNVALFLPVMFLDDRTSGAAFLAGSVFIGVIVALASYPFLKKIGYGLSWTPSRSVMAAGIMGISSLACFGIVGLVIYQKMATQEISRLGVKRHWLGGIRKSEVAARVAELTEAPGPLPRILDHADILKNPSNP